MLKKPSKKTTKAPRDGPTAEVATVADQITDLVETAKEAETLREEKTLLLTETKTLTDALDQAKAEAQGYATEATGVTEQDLQNLLTLRATVQFGFQSTTGRPKVTIQGTGRRRLFAQAETLPAALVLVRANMGKVPQ